MAGEILADGVEKLAAQAEAVLRRASRQGLAVATAESCTGGLLSSLLTDIEGLSGCFERGFAVYTNDAKAEMLGIDRIEIERHGAVSREIAIAMAKGALARSRADLAVSITGFAGPGADGDEEGLVHLAVVCTRGDLIHRECHFGNRGRDCTRHLAAQSALEMIEEMLDRLQTPG